MKSRGRGRGGDWDIDALARQVPGARVMKINLGVLQLPTAPAPEVDDQVEPEKPRKYRNEPTVYAGVRYDSKAESERAKYLLTLEAAGALDWVILQPPFRLGCPENRYRADFLVSEAGRVRAEDVKGVETKDFKRVRKLWRAYGKMPLWIVQGGVVEVLMPRSLDDAEE